MHPPRRRPASSGFHHLSLFLPPPTSPPLNPSNWLPGKVEVEAARRESEREKEEEARRMRGGGGGRKTRKWKLRHVMTLAVRRKILSYYNVCVCGGYALGMRRETVAKTAWVCAGYAPRDCRFKPALGLRWVCAAKLSSKANTAPELLTQRSFETLGGRPDIHLEFDFDFLYTFTRIVLIFILNVYLTVIFIFLFIG